MAPSDAPKAPPPNAPSAGKGTPEGVAPAPVSPQVDSGKSNPDSTSARTDRLVAAEQDTGFSLHQRVTVTGTHHGVMSVVGFARVNVPGIDDPIRCVCIADNSALQAHGVETVILTTPDRLRPTPPLQPN